MIARRTLGCIAAFFGLLLLVGEARAQDNNTASILGVSSAPTGEWTRSCGAAKVAVESDGESGSVGADGSDVIIADMQITLSYPTAGDIGSFAVADITCNLGTHRASWLSYTNQHPVFSQNLFRLKDNRFEQIGMSWVSHGFYAVSESFCAPCLDPTNGTALGVGCADPVSASLNGVQSNMSPRSLINPNTGYFVYPWGGPAPTPGSQERRLLVNKADLNPALNPGARYFVEIHIVHPDDYLAGTQDNNASYREVLVSVTQPGQFGLVIGPTRTTKREHPAIRAWNDVDPSVLETNIRIPGEGLFILGAKSWNTGAGV